MAEPTNGEENNRKSQNAARGQEKPEETPPESGLPDVSKTVRDVRTLWEKAVSPDASPGSSIKAGGIGAGLEAASKLVPRLRRLSKAKEEKEKPEESDFELIELLGKGGMGMVFLARQKSLDREVAVKVIQPQAAGDAEARGKFFAEALVTGELDHPNIVPVYDFGGTPEGVLFYPMKQVRGTSWDKIIQQKSLEENLSILNSVCDAVAFAHDKGVIHRDLKPENVMLGDYGEVFVMDWGLAASVGMEKAEKLTPETGFAGTPAYMAPEMAKCEPTKIGPASDIYLLGGILYEIVTGLRPHTGDEVYSCIHAAMENAIQPTEKKGELVEIALKAMVTEPGNRHKLVKDFQRAIRDYRSHAESLKLSSAADERLSAVKEKPKTEVYRECTETIAGYQQAIELWSQNERAIQGLRKARETFVEVALERGDLALAQSQVAAMEEECGKFLLEKRLESPKDLAEKVNLAIAQAARKEKIARLTRRAALAAAPPLPPPSLVLIVSVTAYFLTRAARDRAEEALRTAEGENYYKIIALADARIADADVAQAEALLWSAPRRLRNWEWGRLMRLCNQELLTLKGHARCVGAIAFSANGKCIATGSWDKTAKIWDAESGRTISTLKGHSMEVESVAFSPDGERVATVDSEDAVRIWDADTGQTLLTVPDSWPPVAFSPDGRRILTGGRDNTARIYDARSGERIVTFEGHSEGVGSAAFSLDGKWALTGGADKTARLWDPGSGNLILTLEGHSGSVSLVAFSEDGERLLTASVDGTAKVWSSQAGQEMSTLRFGVPLSKSLTLSAGPFAFSPDGTQLVSARFDERAAEVWDVREGRVRRILKGHSGSVECAAFSPDGRRIASGSWDGTAKLWDAQADWETAWAQVDARNTCAAFWPERALAAKGADRETIKIWDLVSDDVIEELGLDPLAPWPADGRVLAAATTYTLDSGNGAGVTAIKGEPWCPGCPLDFSPDSKRLVTGTEGPSAKVWDVRTGSRIATLKGHSSFVSFVAFSPDGRSIVTSSLDRTTKVWDAETGREISTLEGHFGFFTPAAFSPDGKRLVGRTADRKVAKVWEVASGREVLTLKGHSDFVASAAFSPDGSRVVTGSADNTTKVWDAQTGREILTLRGGFEAVRNPIMEVEPVLETLNGRAPDRLALLQFINVIVREHDFFQPVAFSSNGRRVLTASDGGAKIWEAFEWNITPEELEKEQRERYRRWLERNHQTSETDQAGVLQLGIEAPAREACGTNLKQIAVAELVWAEEHDGRFREKLSELYPVYVTSLDCFWCPSAGASKITDERLIDSQTIEACIANEIFV